MRTENSTADRNRSKSLDVVLGLSPLLLGLQLIIWIAYLPAAMSGNADFRVFYSGGYLVRSGQASQIYDDSEIKKIQDECVSISPWVLPFIHPAYEALLFAPFSFLHYRAAYFTFLGFNVLCLVIGYWFLRTRLGTLQKRWRWLSPLAVLGFIPIPAALMQGQDSLVLLALLAATLRFIDSGSELAAGLLLGLGMFKFQILIPMACLFFIWRKWQILIGGAISSAAVLASSVALTGIDAQRTYAHKLYDIGLKRHGTDLTVYGVPVAGMPNIRGLVSSVLHVAPGISVATIIISSLVVIVLAAWMGRSVSPQWQFALAISVATLIGYHVLTHDLSIVLIPMAILLSESKERGLWIFPLIWITAPICFFHYSYLFALPLLAFFVVLLTLLPKFSIPGPSNTADDRAWSILIQD
jgi:Glycosyltransferase family 87